MNAGDVVFTLAVTGTAAGGTAVARAVLRGPGPGRRQRPGGPRGPVRARLAAEFSGTEAVFLVAVAAAVTAAGLAVVLWAAGTGEAAAGLLAVGCAAGGVARSAYAAGGAGGEEAR